MECGGTFGWVCVFVRLYIIVFIQSLIFTGMSEVPDISSFVVFLLYFLFKSYGYIWHTKLHPVIATEGICYCGERRQCTAAGRLAVIFRHLADYSS